MSQFAGVFPRPISEQLGPLLQAVWTTGSLKKMEWARNMAELHDWTIAASYKRVSRAIAELDIHTKLLEYGDKTAPVLVRPTFVKRPRTPNTPYSARPSSDRARGFWYIAFFEFSEKAIRPIGVRVISGNGAISSPLWSQPRVDKRQYAFLLSPPPFPSWYGEFGSCFKITSIRCASSPVEVPAGFSKELVKLSQGTSFWSITNDRYKNYFADGFKHIDHHHKALERLDSQYRLESLQSSDLQHAEQVLGFVLLAWWAFECGVVK